jgi:predicted nucleic acid-binding protein
MEKDVVFIDTSVFKANNYFSATSKINKLAELASKGRISIVLTSITKAEVIKHLVRDIENARKSVRKKDNEVLRNIKGADKYYSVLDNLDVEKIASDLVNSFIKRSGAYVIGLEYCKDLEGIFNKYFKQEFPFSEKKQKEFPDAFTLAVLEGYNCSRCYKIIVLSTDPDMQNYESEKLIAVDFKKYISEKMSEDVDLSALYTELSGKSDWLKKRLEREIGAYLDDESLYYDRIENGNIHYVSVYDVRVDFNADDVYINDSNDYTINFELEIRVNYNVGISYDDYTNATYDNEDKEWYGAEYTMEDFDESVSTVVSMKFDKQSKEIEIAEADFAGLL